MKKEGIQKREAERWVEGGVRDGESLEEGQATLRTQRTCGVESGSLGSAVRERGRLEMIES